MRIAGAVDPDAEYEHQLAQGREYDARRRDARKARDRARREAVVLDPWIDDLVAGFNMLSSDQQAEVIVAQYNNLTPDNQARFLGLIGASRYVLAS
jgi:hypothetical protein